MDKKALYNLLGKYLDGRCTPEESKLIDDWLELLNDNKSFAAYTRADLDSIHNRIWEKIQQDISTTGVPEKAAPLKPTAAPARAIRMVRWVAAACVIGVVSFIGFYNYRQNAMPKETAFTNIIPPSGMITRSNNGAVALPLTLEDSSTVLLQPGTVLHYPVHFQDAKREVYLEGEAFFQVSKNARRPFYIYHNNLVTHVLGTSFTINTQKEGNKAEVAVVTGRVEVSENSQLIHAQANTKPAGVILTPNQKVIYTQQSRTFVSSIVDKPLLVKNNEPVAFNFQNSTVANVLTALSKAYGIETVAENENINKCTFTGDISAEDLYGKLDI
ncbi:MAG TPA: FecR domain-containing protein, partial [Chitinophagaceae bacterium]|nr:FecR domain-containing protein [Chitinophagaceae bacterium]